MFGDNYHNAVLALEAFALKLKQAADQQNTRRAHGRRRSQRSGRSSSSRGHPEPTPYEELATLCVQAGELKAAPNAKQSVRILTSMFMHLANVASALCTEDNANGLYLLFGAIKNTAYESLLRNIEPVFSDDGTGQIVNYHSPDTTKKLATKIWNIGQNLKLMIPVSPDSSPLTTPTDPSPKL